MEDCSIIAISLECMEVDPLALCKGPERTVIILEKKAAQGGSEGSAPRGRSIQCRAASGRTAPGTREATHDPEVSRIKNCE